MSNGHLRVNDVKISDLCESEWEAEREESVQPCLLLLLWRQPYWILRRPIEGSSVLPTSQIGSWENL